MSIEPADRLKGVGEYYFSRKLEEIARMRAAGADVISLGIGSPDLEPPRAAIDASMKALQVPGSHGYPSYRSTLELRQAMAGFYERTYGVKLDPETQVLPLLGSKEGILYLSLAYLNPGDAVLVPDTGYPAYDAVARLIGARSRHYALNEKNGWLPDLDALEKAGLAGVKLMWVNYPHMPTGASAPDGFFTRLAAFAQRHGILVCNDNPYSLVLNSRAPKSLLADDPKFEACVELNSLSKSFNMAGWRVGMLVGGRAVVNAVLQVKSNVDSGMFLPIQAGAAAALATGEDWHRQRNQVYAERRERVWKLFDRLGFRYERDQVGLFVWARSPEHHADVAAFLDELLAKAQVFLTPGMVFGTGGTRYARASLCASSERLDEALRRVNAVFGGAPS